MKAAMARSGQTQLLQQASWIPVSLWGGPPGPRGTASSRWRVGLQHPGGQAIFHDFSGL